MSEYCNGPYEISIIYPHIMYFNYHLFGRIMLCLHNYTVLMQPVSAIKCIFTVIIVPLSAPGDLGDFKINMVVSILSLQAKSPN